jgi:energy-coupling factor transport system ATP-binding protein
VLLGDGVVIADGDAAEVLSGGWYFATEVARILGLPGVVDAETGAERIGRGR